MSPGTGHPLRRGAGTRAVIAAASLGVSLAIGVAAAQTALHGGDPQGATLTAKALERAEDNTELRSWLALDMAAQGDLETAVTILRDVIRQDERWLELLRRLPSADLLKPELLAQLEDRLKAPSTRSR